MSYKKKDKLNQSDNKDKSTFNYSDNLVYLK